MKRKILILGSAGFLGSNLTRNILYKHKDYNIIGVDKLASASSMHNVYSNKAHEFYIGDISNAHFLTRIFEIHQPDFVINVAGSNSYDKYENLEIVQGVINALHLSSTCEVEKFIHISDWTSYSTKTENKESDQLYPKTLRAGINLGIESIITGFCEETGLKHNIIRSSEVFGPRQPLYFFIPTIYFSCKSPNGITLFSKGETVRNLLYIDDFCSGVVTVLTKGASNTTYNLSANNDFSELEIAHMIVDHIGQGSIALSSDTTLHTLNDNFYKLNTEKINALDWKPAKKFKEALKYTLGWYDNNGWIFK